MTAEFFATINSEVGTLLEYAPPGAMMTNGMLCSCATASEETADCPMSNEPALTAVAIAVPALSELTSTSKPAFLKRPRSIA